MWTSDTERTAESGTDRPRYCGPQVTQTAPENPESTQNTDGHRKLHKRCSRHERTGEYDCDVMTLMAADHREMVTEALHRYYPQRSPNYSVLLRTTETFFTDTLETSSPEMSRS